MSTLFFTVSESTDEIIMKLQTSWYKSIETKKGINDVIMTWHCYIVLMYRNNHHFMDHLLSSEYSGSTSCLFFNWFASLRGRQKVKCKWHKYLVTAACMQILLLHKMNRQKKRYKIQHPRTSYLFSNAAWNLPISRLIQYNRNQFVWKLNHPSCLRRLYNFAFTKRIKLRNTTSSFLRTPWNHTVGNRNLQNSIVLGGFNDIYNLIKVWCRSVV